MARPCPKAIVLCSVAWLAACNRAGRWEKASQSSLDLFEKGRFAQALAPGEEALTMADDWFKPADLLKEVVVLVQQAHGAISGPAADGFARLGTLYVEWGLYEQAEPLLNRAGAILSRIGEPSPAVRASLDEGLCVIAVDTGRLEAARQACPAALGARQGLVPPDHPDMARALTAMGLYHLRSGRPDKAEAHLEAALKVYEDTPGADVQGLASALMASAEVKASRGDLAGAEEAFGRAKARSESPYATVKALIREAGFELRGGQARKAAGALNEALALHAELPLADGFDREIILLGLGESNAAQGRLDDAEHFLARAVEAAENRHGVGTQEVTGALRALGKAQVSAKRYGKAAGTARRLREIGDSYGPRNPLGRRAYESAAGLYRSMGSRAAAERLERAKGL
ncbi:MAG: tetratricopeptide repeat protein [Elusimicrobia bacterium]|nr:tetratricopeptide repeat protein [Elusimicrobiota bacterium]